MLFYDTELIENYGSGIQKVINECQRLGFPDPEFSEEDGGFQVIFHKDIYNEEYLTKTGLNERQIKAVIYVKEKGKISNQTYQDITDVKKRQASDDLKEIEEKGIFEKVGTTGRGTYYQLKGHQRGERGTKRASKGRQAPHKRPKRARKGP